MDLPGSVPDNLTTTPLPKKGFAAPILLVGLVVAVLVAGGGYFAYKSTQSAKVMTPAKTIQKSSETMTSPSPKASGSAVPSLAPSSAAAVEEGISDQDVTALDNDLSSIDQALTDQPGDLAE